MLLCGAEMETCVVLSCHYLILISFASLTTPPLLPFQPVSDYCYELLISAWCHISSCTNTQWQHHHLHRVDLRGKTQCINNGNESLSYESIIVNIFIPSTRYLQPHHDAENMAKSNIMNKTTWVCGNKFFSTNKLAANEKVHGYLGVICNAVLFCWGEQRLNIFITTLLLNSPLQKKICMHFSIHRSVDKNF